MRLRDPGILAKYEVKIRMMSLLEGNEKLRLDIAKRPRCRVGKFWQKY